jgi:sugar lactone lactonase YvrE
MQHIDTHDGGLFTAAPARIVASWPAGSFAENILAKNSGEILIALYTDNRIDLYDPSSETVRPFADLPAPAVSVAEGPDGQIWAVGGTFFVGPGAVWKIDPEGRADLWIHLPEARFLNGCAIHPNGHQLLVCDSHLGHILAVDLHQRNRAEIWLADSRLVPLNKRKPGVNGIKFFQDHVWFSVTDQDLMYRALVQPDGTPSSLEVVHSNLHVDDFTFREDGTLYYTTHTLNSVGRIEPGGARITFGGPEQDLVGATACVFGQTASTRHLLYVTTDGGYFAPYPGTEQAALLVEIDLRQG